MLKGKSTIFYVAVQLVLMVNVVDWSNRFLSACCIDRECWACSCSMCFSWIQHRHLTSQWRRRRQEELQLISACTLPPGGVLYVSCLLSVCPHWHVNIPSYFSVNIIYCLDWLHLPSTLTGYPHITWRIVPFKVCHSEEFGGILLYSTLLLLIEKCSRLRVHHWNKTGNHSPLNKIINAHSLDILTNLTSDPEHS